MLYAAIEEARLPMLNFVLYDNFVLIMMTVIMIMIVVTLTRKVVTLMASKPFDNVDTDRRLLGLH